MIHTNEIRIRDPFIVPDKEKSMYYLFGTTDTDPWNGRGEGFRVYTSRDLIQWSEPAYAFRAPQDFWASKNFWAPEVHFFCDAWYMFASFKSDCRCRGVQILRSENIAGPYAPISDGPITPADWECLDGTLFVEDGQPWLIFSHEWTQIGNGAICCASLSADLGKMTSEPMVLFHAKDAPWSVPDTGDVVVGKGENYVTDGPFVYFNSKGKLCMIWSSFSKNGYAIGIAESESGKILGPWKQQDAPFVQTGGHGMLFTDFYEKRFLAIHSPNDCGAERLKLIKFNE